MSDESVYTLNRRILVHESETSMRGHDEDGACCLRARLTPLPEEADEPWPRVVHIGGCNEHCVDGGHFIPAALELDL